MLHKRQGKDWHQQYGNTYAREISVQQIVTFHILQRVNGECVVHLIRIQLVIQIVFVLEKETAKSVSL